MARACRHWRLRHRHGGDGLRLRWQMVAQGGDGVPPKYFEAFRLTRLAAERDLPSALLLLAQVLELGQVGPPNLAEAIDYRRAARQTLDPMTQNLAHAALVRLGAQE